MSPVRVLRGFIFGGIGGFLAWLLCEFLPPPFPSPPFRIHLWESGVAPPPIGPDLAGVQGLILGLCIGGFLGISEGIGEGTYARFRRSALWFTVLGAVGGFVGLYFGQLLFQQLGGRVEQPTNAAEFFRMIFVRGFSWMLMGLFLGTVFGIPTLSVRRMINGAIGGAIGGFLGGFFLQTLTSTGLFQGMQGRLVGFTLIGALIGFFINLLAEVMKRVWVKILIGRNEGREYALDMPLAYVGRDELAEIPVFLDPAVPRRMASFRFNSGRYALHAESTLLPITVNGQPFTPGQILRDGDAIQFGRVTLGFYEKATATDSVRAVDRVTLAAPAPPAGGGMPIPRGPNVCEFCGQQRDPATGACACTVPGDTGGGGYGAPAYGAPSYGEPAPGGYSVPGYGAPAYAPPADPGYGATMLDPGGAGMATGGQARLVATEGPYTGHIFPIPGAEAGIGRDVSQEVPLPNDGTASRRHARVYWANGNWILRDEGSANGTWINGVRIQEQALFPGDSFRVGHSHFRFEA